MPFIEGVGDEVTQFFGIVLLGLLAVLAWWSTSIRDLPQINTVLILERRSRNSSLQSSSVHLPARIDNNGGNVNTCEVNNTRINRTLENKNEVDPNAANILSQRLESSSNPSENSDENFCDSGLPDVSNITNEKVSTSAVGENIRIRLKYLNEDQKLVDGRLQELLGDFKRRHFSMELAAQKLVRLIFNGQVLQKDDQTLQRCGLYDNCVVHCLVHTQQNANRTASLQNNNAPPQEWNLGVFLYAFLSVILGAAWVCRFQYSHLFNITTTTALVGLTGMFVVAVIGLYMPDQERTM